MSALTPSSNAAKHSRRPPWPLYLLLGFYIAISFSFYVGGVIAATQQWFFSSRYSSVPFDVNEQTGLIDSTKTEAKQAGLLVGDRLLSLNGAPFTGDYQLLMYVRRSLPGSSLTVTVKRSDQPIDIRIPLAPREGPPRDAGTMGLFVTLVLLPLLSLSVGYWVVAVRPTDWNAWLALIVLTNTESFFGNLDWRWWPNPWFTIFGGWVVAVSMLSDPALLLLAINFPERWRADVRWPWAKWLILVPQFIAFPLAVLYLYVNCFYADWGPAIAPAAFYANNVPHVFSVLTNVLFWFAVFDKLRSAGTADARRRLRLLAIGSAISLGPVEVMFILFPLLGLDPHHNALYELIVPFYAIFIITLAYVLGVQRALGVRILVRMGAKYALARGVVWVLRISVIALVILLFNTPTRDFAFTFARIAGIVVLIGLLRWGAFKRFSAWVDRRFFREAYNTELVLTELSEDVRRFTDKGPLLDTVVRRISDVLHVPQIAVWLRGSETFHLQQAIGMRTPFGPLLSGESATVQAVARAERPLTVYRENPDEWFVQAPREEQNLLNSANTELLLGLIGRDQLMGVIALGPKRSEEPYSPSDLRLLGSVAMQTGLALEVSDLAQSLAKEAAQRERIHREIEIAREVQERLFPQKVPALSGVDLAGYCRPAQGVGGDYYDFIELEGGRLGLAIGDVSGKGIPAALLMATLRALLHGMTLYGSGDLAALMQKVNRLVFEASSANRYATFFFGVYDPATQELRYVNAGHNPPLVLRANQVLRLETGGPVVGLLPIAPFSQGSLALAPEDILLAYTDGISEAMTADDEEWGEERMIAALQNARSGGAAGIIAQVFEDADAFIRGAPQHDDMTLLAMKLTARPG